MADFIVSANDEKSENYFRSSGFFEITYCKDCKYIATQYCLKASSDDYDPLWFCADGRKKEKNEKKAVD